MKLQVLLSVALLFIASQSFGESVKIVKSISVDDICDSINDARIDSIHIAIDSVIDGLYDSTHIEIGLDLSSKSVFVGRIFGSKGLLYNPNFTYFHKSGIGFSITSSFWQKAKLSAAITDLNLNYRHKITDWWDFEVDYIYWVYHKNIIDNLDWNNLFDCTNSINIKDIVSANTDIVFMFGSETALLFQEYLSHPFYWYTSTKNERFSFEPELGIYLGNTSIYKRKLISTTSSDLVDKSFGMLDYYASAHINYQVKKWSFGMSYEIDIPQSAKHADNKAPQIGFFSFSFKRIFTL